MTVRVGDASVSGGADVEVGVDRPPVVEGFSPSIVGAGETLTIEGSYFDDDRLLNAVLIDAEVSATVESASPTQLVVRVPATVAAGPITVTTPAGQAESSSDVTVAPPPAAGDDVEVVTHAIAGAPTTVALDGVEGRFGLVVFEGDAGQRPSVSFSDWEFPACGLDYGLFGPGGIELTPLSDLSPAAMASRCDQEFPGLPPRLPVTGTYAVVLEDVAGQPGSVGVRVELDEAEEVDEPTEVSGGTTRVAQPGGLLDGDATYPVDLATGRFVYEATDLVVSDVLPVGVSRGYRQPVGLGAGSGGGAFGSGTALEFELFLRVSPANQFADLVVDESRPPIVYERVSDGVDVEHAVFDPVSTPSTFHGSRITWNGRGWDLRLRDGPTLVFHRGGPLQAVRDPAGNQIVVHRERNESTGRLGRVLSVTSPFGRSISFVYDAEDRVVEATDELGRSVTYGYDPEGRLAQVGYPEGVELRYGYDDQGRMTTIAGPDGAGLTIEYDDDGRVVPSRGGAAASGRADRRR
ncbi:MAG: DUF6531 domain-containing protein [Acidimicrobiales bacterium]